MNCLRLLSCLFFQINAVHTSQSERVKQKYLKDTRLATKATLATSWFAFWNSRTFDGSRDSYKFIILFKISHSLTISWPTKCGLDSFVLSLSLHAQRKICLICKIFILKQRRLGISFKRVSAVDCIWSNWNWNMEAKYFVIYQDIHISFSIPISLRMPSGTLFLSKVANDPIITGHCLIRSAGMEIFAQLTGM